MVSVDTTLRIKWVCRFLGFGPSPQKKMVSTRHPYGMVATWVFNQHEVQASMTIVLRGRSPKFHHPVDPFTCLVGNQGNHPLKPKGQYLQLFSFAGNHGYLLGQNAWDPLGPWNHFSRPLTSGSIRIRRLPKIPRRPGDGIGAPETQKAWQGRNGETTWGVKGVLIVGGFGFG